ncbi:hypothetical protein GN330_14070 [Nitratireductor sp. CAU 1489]|uniref:FAD dependent oxidoreductase n=1 Tax=Nitratireductor arenosus TaxID=2682096 RepID=A0A844QKE2_9HYPH|nr:hypothetical protein [Nitratireductor arenosus]MVA98371.1 hypothetical protein [Nitratireductor arenosus]
MARIAIIGGGPAGLAAAFCLAASGIEFRLFEAGRALEERHHDRADELGCGIGGAGLFSDGKFSFHPSGSHLYRLRDKDRLWSAYDQISALLDGVGIKVPVTDRADGGDFVWTGDPITTKDYPSSYGTLAQRAELIAALSRDYRPWIRTGTTVEQVSRHGTGYTVRSRPAGGFTRDENFSHIIVATGRFGPQATASLMPGLVPTTELRYEFGIRIEHPNRVGFLNAVDRPDVKYIINALGTEVRTFCTCRNGEVWLIPYNGPSALSGRSDGPPSGFSNFGLLARFSGDAVEKGRRIWRHYQAAIAGSGSALWQPLPEFLDRTPTGTPGLDGRPWHPRAEFRRGNIAAMLHAELHAILAGSLRVLVDQFPDLYSAETVCLFPAIEGVGAFPRNDLDLKGPAENIWFCGDAVGRFRGLIPALVSGGYAAAAACSAIAGNDSADADRQSDLGVAAE